MGDLASYREKATLFGKKAYDADQAQNYTEAFDHYFNACKVFQHMVKCKKYQFILSILFCIFF
jgi:hypothetical protein